MRTRSILALLSLAFLLLVWLAYVLGHPTIAGFLLGVPAGGALVGFLFCWELAKNAAALKAFRP